MKKLVGVASPAFLWENDNTNLDFYRFSNNYGKRVYACGGIPVGILPEDGRIPDGVLDRFDAFIICGGKKMWPHHFQVVDYAVRNGKPLLGICLGMQAIHRYFKYRDWMEDMGFEGDVYDFFEQYSQGKDFTTLTAVEGHCKTFPRENTDTCKHRVNLEPNSHIARIVGSDHLNAVTVHSYQVFEPSDKLTITGHAEDGTIEVIEYGDNILGVQFHPEADDTLLPIFEFLMK